MQKITFSIDIKAPKEKVWYSLWDEENYENWTSAFSEGSHAISDWNEGSKIYFLGSGGGGGMSSKINIKKIVVAKKTANDGAVFNNLSFETI